MSSNGAVTYTPSADFNGTDSFTYRVKDNEGDTSNIATVTITVSSENDAPLAESQTLTTNEDEPLSITLNASDTEEDALTFVVQSEPTQGTLSGTGENLVYTPDENYNGADSFAFLVNDGASDSEIATISITVLPVNDAPIDEDESVTITNVNEVLIIDVLGNSEDPDGDVLSVISAVSEDGDVVINDDGTISFFANEGFAGTATITYIISDGNGGEVTATVTITLDASNLPPLAVDDEFVFDIAEFYILDALANDSDPEGDALTITNVSSSFGVGEIVEDKIKFTPNEGANGEFVITYRISDGINEDEVASIFLSVNLLTGPIITLPTDICGPRTVNANALYTLVDLGQASAVDRFGNTLPVSLLNGVSLFPPGQNEAVWSATDADGVTSVAIQKVCVNPLISIAKDQLVLEGQNVVVGVYFNGASPTYPVLVPYTVAGSADASDHDLVSGTLSIESGSEGFIEFSTFEDGIDESNEQVTVTLFADLNVGSKNVHTAMLEEGNIAPEITLAVAQQSETRLTVSKTDGIVGITARVFDPNEDDTFLYEWSQSNEQLANLSTTDIRYAFDPTDLDIGVYTITLKVIDSGAPNLTDIESVYIEVVESLVQLGDGDSDGDLIPDNVEGFKDTDGGGIPDYLDRIMECNVLPESVATQDGYLVEGDAGVCLRRGDFTIGKETGGAQLTPNDIASDAQDELIPDLEAENIGGVFDFIAYGLPDEGTTYGIVIPQIRPVPVAAVYRKFNSNTGWGFFVEDTNNSIWSAQGIPGYCPPPNTTEGQTQWSPGLTAGHWCVQLILEDGGPNDDDNLVNGTIVDPGGVSVMLSSNQRPIASVDEAELYMNSEITIDVLANDIDPDNDTLTLTSANPSIGNVAIVDNQLFYQAPRDYVGPVVVIYGITDDNGGTDIAEVLITIQPNAGPSVIDQLSQIE